MKKPSNTKTIVTEINSAALSNAKGGTFRLTDLRELALNVISSPLPSFVRPRVGDLSPSFGQKK